MRYELILDETIHILIIDLQKMPQRNLRHSLLNFYNDGGNAIMKNSEKIV